MTTNQNKQPTTISVEGDTPTLRLFALLEVIAAKDEFFSLQSLVEETGIPKPTLHRMLQQLESSGIIQRDGDNRHYSSGLRLRNLAETILLNSTTHSARHNVLLQLADEVGESCNLTAIAGNEVIYVDRVETQAPLRFCLQSGSRVPVHCSATGKLLLSGMSKSQRKRLLGSSLFTQYTEKTITDIVALEAEIEKAKKTGYAIDNEEYLPGLFCVAVMIPRAGGQSNLSLAIQAPIMRVKPEDALHFLPALQRAALAMEKIESESWPKD